MDLSMLPDFIVEAVEHLEEMENSLLQLEQDQENKDFLNEVFRSIHSIKGAAQYIGLERVSELSHRLESLLDLIRQGKKPLNEETIDLFITAKDRIGLLVNELERNQTEDSEIDDLLHRINKYVDNSHNDKNGSDVKEDAAPQESDKDPSRLVNECSNEEYDGKLFNIFMGNLEEKLSFLQSKITEFDTSSGKIEVLNRCSDIIKSLSASSYYMGYDRLCEYYQSWQNEIDLARLKISSGAEAEIGFMQVYHDEILRVYPHSLVKTDQQQTEQAFDSHFEGSFEEMAAHEKHDNDNPVSEEPEIASEKLLADLSNAFDKTTDTTTPTAENSGLVNESLEDEHDEELLDIFIQNLKENIAFLQLQMAGLEASLNKEAVLDRCRETVKSLHSSAKYMGYNMLCGHYQAWRDETDSAIQKISSGTGTELDFMQTYLNEIIGAYPEAATENGLQPLETSGEKATADSEENNLDETLDSLFSESLEDSDPLEQGIVPDPIDGTDRVEEGVQETASDSFDETIDTSPLVIEVAKLESENLEEEYDEELLDIFMEQLRENIAFLQTQIVEIETSFNQEAVLERCGNTIKSLRSSANYMGYDMLCKHYTAWQTAIDNSAKALFSGKEIDFSFMQVYLDEIHRVYLQTEKGADQQEEKLSADLPEDNTISYPELDEFDASLGPDLNESPESSATQEQDKASLDDKNLDDVVSTIGELLSEPSSTDTSDTATEEKEESVTPVSDTTLSEKQLFGKLSSALDASFAENVSGPEKQMHSVIEEMISPSVNKVVVKKDTIKETVPVKDSPSVTGAKSVEPARSAPNDKINKVSRQQQDNDQQRERRSIERRIGERREQDTASAKTIKHSMRVDADKIDYLMNQVGELVVSRAYFAQLFSEMKALQQNLLEKPGITKTQLKPLNEFSFRLGEAGVALGRVSNELQEAVMKVRMLPIEQLFKRYPRLVRDLVKKSNKQVNLVVKGEETELDKMVIEEISDPLIHVLRNAVDHGIETVSERRRLGKPETGTLTLVAYHESNHIVIEIIDDGKGIDPELIKEKALEKGLFSEEELGRMPARELTRMIMLPGFSTADKATETSGRGVGMDVVKKNIEKLNGTLDIESEVGQRTRMRIKIPLTLAIIQALMVRVDMETFTIPLTAVEETLRIYQHEISEIEGVEVIHLRNSTMPIFRLSKIFDMRRKSETVSQDKYFVVVVSTGMQEVGLVVDELLGQEEVVIKPLADYLREGSGFSGATIIGDGAISLILDVPELVKMTTERQVLRQKDLSFMRRRKGIRTTEQHDHIVH